MPVLNGPVLLLQRQSVPSVGLSFAQIGGVNETLSGGLPSEGGVHLRAIRSCLSAVVDVGSVPYHVLDGIGHCVLQQLHKLVLARVLQTVRELQKELVRGVSRNDHPLGHGNRLGRRRAKDFGDAGIDKHLVLGTDLGVVLPSHESGRNGLTEISPVSISLLLLLMLLRRMGRVLVAGPFIALLLMLPKKRPLDLLLLRPASYNVDIKILSRLFPVMRLQLQQLVESFGCDRAVQR